METIRLEKEKYLVRKGTPLTKVFILVNGTMIMHTINDQFVLKSGSIIGLIECTSMSYICDYYAAEDSVLVAYPFHYVEDFQQIFLQQPQYAYGFVHGAITLCGELMKRYELIQNQLRIYYQDAQDTYEMYENLCADYGVRRNTTHFEDMIPMVKLTMEVRPWELEYNKAMASKDSKLLQMLYDKDIHLCIGEIQHASGVMNRAVRAMQEMIEYMMNNRRFLLSPDGNDYFFLYFDLKKKLAAQGISDPKLDEYMERMCSFIQNAHLSGRLFYDADIVEKRVGEYQVYDFNKLVQTTELEETSLLDDINEPEVEIREHLEVEIQEETEDEQSTDCLEVILNYAQESEERITEIRHLIDKYRMLPDIYATDDDTRAVRRTLTNVFFEIYEKAFFLSMEDEEEPDEILQMFFQFGFMDVQLAGAENANLLYELTDKLYLCNSENVYTIYTWLSAIYFGQKEPSRNEFDLDYSAYLREQLKTGKMDKAQVQKLESDQVEKVKFEIRNMFVATNRATYGRYTTYCAVLREEDLIKSVDDLLVTSHAIHEAINAVRQIDYSCFFREIYIADPEHDLPRQQIKTEVLPDVILMPNAGNKGMMWQETGDKRRDSPARFMFPIFTAADIDDLMEECCGRYRWEICRKIQGMRWNDIRERSLTAEYCDYLQFYRKNRDLSTDAKDKLKNALVRAKNNYREVFVRDYVNWLRYESKGSVRLNKVARDILFRYCPFSRERRKELAESPMFRDLIGKFEIFNEREARHMETVFSRYEKAGGEMLPELTAYRDFFEQ